jgi:putative addiction module killer protein
MCQYRAAHDIAWGLRVPHSELRINRGPGYRVYFGWDGKLLVILLGGGTNRRQQNNIQSALRHWRSYKTRKAAGRTGRK